MTEEQRQNDEWLTVEDAAVVLGVSARQVNHMGSQGRIRTRHAKAGGRRILYLREDLDAIAAERFKPILPQLKPQRAELMPISEYRAHVEKLEETLAAMARRIGYLEGQLEERKYILEDSQRARDDLDQLRREREEMRRVIEELTRPTVKPSFWRRLFGGSD